MYLLVDSLGCHQNSTLPLRLQVVLEPIVVGPNGAFVELLV